MDKKKRVEAFLKIFKKFESSLDSLSKQLHAILSQPEFSFVIDVRYRKKKHTYNIYNPTTKEEMKEVDQARKDLILSLLKKMLLVKAKKPLVKDYGLYEFLLNFANTASPKEFKMIIDKDAPVEVVDVDQEQIESWKRLRKIYFPEENHD